MIPKDLENTLKSLDFEHDGYISFKNFKLDNTVGELLIEVNPRTDEQPIENWKITITNHRKHEILKSGCQNLELTDNHWLLSSVNQDSGELFVNKLKSHKRDLFRELYTLHRANFGDWIPFDKYIPHEFHHLDKFSFDFGFFAKGPLDILEIYAKKLREFYAVVNIIRSKDRIRRTELYDYDIETTKYKILVLGDSTIIGEHFDFTKVK